MPHWYGTHKSFGSPLRSPRRIGVQSHKKKKKNGAAAAASPNSSTSRLSAVPDLSANYSPTTTYYQGTSGITVQSGVTTISRTNDAERNLYKQVKKALQKQASLEDLQALVLQNPSVVELMNDDGWFLLHYACYYYSSASFQVIEFLVKLFPAAVSRAADETQVTPLHLACFRAASLNIIQLIVQYDKTGVRRVNAEGWTPLYFAVLSNAELAVIEYLVQLYPIACLLIVDKTRGTYPLLVLEKEKAKRQQKQHDNPRHHQDILDFIARCTVDGTLGLLEAAASNASSSKALAVKVHILKMQKQYDIPLDNDNVLRQWLLQHTTALHHLLNDDNMQGMLLENNKTVQEHVWRRQQQQQQMTSQNSKLLTTLSPLPKSSSSRKIKIKDRHASSVVLGGGDDHLLSPPFSKSKETSSSPNNKKSPARNTLSAPCLLKQSPPPSRRERKGGGGGGTSTMPASTAKKNSSSSVPDIPLLQFDDDDKEGRRNLSAPNLLQKKRSPPPPLKPLPFPANDLSSDMFVT